MLVGFFALPALLVYWVAQRSPTPPPRTSNTGAVATSSSPRVTAPAPILSAPVGDPPQLVASLSELDVSAGPITPARAVQWKQTLQVLVQKGVAAVPAIREFLAKNVDLDLEPIPGGDALGYPTMRLALFEVLRQIVRPESIAVSLEVLKATADPKEIAVLARNLEEQAPAQHRPVAVAAAREALAQANRGQLEGPDIGPVFEVLEHYGDAKVVGELEQSAQKWNFYATIALGGLSSGAGIPALTRLAQDASLPNAAALRVLAQLAAKYPEAQKFLVEQVRANKLPFGAWPGVESALSGEVIDYSVPVLSTNSPLTGSNSRTFHISYGNQNYRMLPAPADWSQAQIKDQLAVIDQIIAVDASMETLEFLQRARLALAGRITKQ